MSTSKMATLTAQALMEVIEPYFAYFFWGQLTVFLRGRQGA
jgi:hypothetical protein